MSPSKTSPVFPYSSLNESLVDTHTQQQSPKWYSSQSHVSAFLIANANNMHFNYTLIIYYGQFLSRTYCLWNYPQKITCGLWQIRTELLRTHCVNVPKKAINLKRPTWEQFIWALVDDFILDLNISVTWRYWQVSSMPWTLLFLVRSVRKVAYLTADEGVAYRSCCLWLHLSASKYFMTHFPQQTLHETGIQKSMSGECLRGSSQTTVLLIARESILGYLEQLTKANSNRFP